MPTSKKPRKRYKPKPVYANPVEYVLEGFKPLRNHDDYLLDLKTKNHMAATVLLRGDATKKDIDTLIACHNISEALFRLGFGQEYGDSIIRGKRALLDLCARGYKSGKFVCGSEEIQAINELMELHDAQMDVITVGEIHKALALARKEMKSDRALKINRYLDSVEKLHVTQQHRATAEAD